MSKISEPPSGGFFMPKENTHGKCRFCGRETVLGIDSHERGHGSQCPECRRLFMTVSEFRIRKDGEKPELIGGRRVFVDDEEIITFDFS